jgi:chemotaxis signal transduction protein
LVVRDYEKQVVVDTGAITVAVSRTDAIGDAMPGDVMALLEQIRRLESELAESWSKLGQVPEKHAEQLHALEVTVAGRIYLIPAASIREVVSMVWPEPLSGAPDWVLGTFAYGSQTISMIDLGLRLEHQPSQLLPEMFLVVVDQPCWLGLAVSGIGRVLEIAPEALTTPGPQTPRAGFLLAAMHGDDGKVVHLLSVGSLGRELDQSLPAAPVGDESAGGGEA